jgi:hypothetical protein
MAAPLERESCLSVSASIKPGLQVSSSMYSPTFRSVLRFSDVSIELECSLFYKEPIISNIANPHV